MSHYIRYANPACLAILTEARDLVARQDGWCQGWYARTATGMDCDPASKEACSLCAAGAIARAARVSISLEGHGEGPLTGLDAYAALCASLGTVVPAFNDREGRTQADVVAAFDAAIARVRSLMVEATP